MDYFASQPALLFLYLISGSKSYRDFGDTGPRPPCPSRQLVTQREEINTLKSLLNVQLTDYITKPLGHDLIMFSVCL